MGKIYQNQSALDLYLDTKIDLTSAKSYEIRYIDPRGTVGTLTATLESDKTTLCHRFQAGELKYSGVWTFWTYAVMADDREAPGEAYKVTVYSRGQ